MKHNIFFWVIIFSIAITQLFYAMEEQPLTHTYILDAGFVYLCKKKAFDSYHPKIINLKKSKKNELNTYYYNDYRFKIHPDRTKIIFFKNNKIEIYCVKNKSIIYSCTIAKQTQSIQNIDINLNNNILLTFYNDTRQYYAKFDKDINNNNILHPIPISRNITHSILHPTKPIICGINNTREIQTYNFESSQIEQPPWHKLKYKPYHIRTSFGNLIAIMNKEANIISIINFNNIKNILRQFTCQKNEKFCSMEFYLKGPILTIILCDQKKQNLSLQYWDIRKNECINTTELSDNNFGINFYFSRGGKKIILFHKTCNQSHMYYVPDKVRYTDSCDKYLILKLLMELLIEKHNLFIPKEIIIIITKIIKISPRQLELKNKFNKKRSTISSYQITY
jgi:hypothetical protein